MLNKKFTTAVAACSLLAGVAFSSIASAHTAWMLPSHFTISKEGGDWLTFDYTAANSTFVFDKPASADAARIIMPDGRQERPAFVFKGKRRSVFDFEFTEQGTHKVTIVGTPRYMTHYKVGKRDSVKRSRANKVERVTQLPEGARDVETSMSLGRVESYITVGKPSEKAFAIQGKGLELKPITHPSDIVAQEPVRLQLYFNGKPQAGTKVSIIREGVPYRNQQEELKLESDKEGFVDFTPEVAGRYLLVASHQSKLVDNQFADVLRGSVNLTFEVVLP